MKDRMLNFLKPEVDESYIGVVLLRKLFYATRRIKKECFNVKTMYTVLFLAFLKTQSLENNVCSMKKKKEQEVY